MWRYSLPSSSRLLSSFSRNPNPSHIFLSSSVAKVHSLSSDPFKLGFQKHDAIKSFATLINGKSSLASPSVMKARDSVHMLKHYGRCYWELSKARLSMLVVATSGCGFVLGCGDTIDFVRLCWTCAGTMMVAASANSLNQVFEINNDARMKRTRQRPLPSGRITTPHAVAWASCVGLAGTALLASKVNTWAAGLAASNLVLYAFVYTPLKQIHPVNTWAGAVVGAIPPLLGWAAASGEVSLNGMVLPAALYFWQIPHFMALAYLCRNDYAAGGFRMISLFDCSGEKTAMAALRNCLYLVPLGFLAYDWGLTSGWFCLESSLLAAAISATSYSFYKNRTTKNARRMFHASLLYLPVFMSGLVFHRRCTDTDPQLISEECSERIHEELPLLPAFVNQVRPPVAYASVAPFPFLPAPSYGGYI